MPALNDSERLLLGQPISPFEESDKPDHEKQPRDGESRRDEFEQLIHDGIDDKKPTHRYVELTTAEIDIHLKRKGRYQEKCFLWILDEVSIKMIRERTPNASRTHDNQHVCHTNLTAWGKAFAGGELFFGEDGKLYVNYFSDRYGGKRLTETQWQTILSYFRRAGYENVVDILELLAS